MGFLDTDYKVPSGNSNYMKLLDGVNTFRILSSAIVGYEYWNVENKPVRQKEKFSLIPEDIKIEKDGSFSIKHFWAFVVWDYADKAIKVLEVTQSTVQRAMKIKIDNRKGDAKGYDFIITREGSGLGTEYDVDVTEAAPIDPQIVADYEAKHIDLEELYTGGDPFMAKKTLTKEESDLVDKTKF